LRNLWYTRHNDGQHLDIEGGWISHGDEEGSSKEAREESGEEEEVGLTEEATATSPPHLPVFPFPEFFQIQTRLLIDRSPKSIWRGSLLSCFRALP
jgi:hypothetical protein